MLKTVSVVLAGALVAASWLASAASAQPAPDLRQCSLPPDTSTLRTGYNCRRIVIDGFARDYVVEVPYPRPTQPIPVIIDFPDAGADFAFFARTSGFNAAVEDGEAILIVPHSLPYLLPDGRGGEAWQRRWAGLDAGLLAATPRLPDYPADAPWPADDFAFIEAILAAVAAELPVDQEQVFVAGLGDAATFAVWFAHERPALIAAAAVGVAGFDLGLPPGLPTVARSVRLFAVLGDGDPAATAAFDGRNAPLDAAALLADPARFATVTTAFGLEPAACLENLRSDLDDNVLIVGFCRSDGWGGFTFVLVGGVGYEAPNYINNPAHYTFAREARTFFRSAASGR